MVLCTILYCVIIIIIYFNLKRIVKLRYIIIIILYLYTRIIRSTILPYRRTRNIYIISRRFVSQYNIIGAINIIGFIFRGG